MKVLIVDDDRESRVFWEKLVSPMATSVAKATNGGDALRMMDRERPDLVVSKRAVPGLNGIDLVRRIRRQTKTHYVFVILVATTRSPADVGAAFEAGVDEYLTPPFERVMIAARLRAAKRIINWVSDLEAVRQQAPEAAAAAAASADDARLADSNSWKQLPKAVGDTLAGFLNVELADHEVADGLDGEVDAEVTSTIVMSDVDHNLVLALGIVADNSSGAKIGELMFGEADPSLLGDLLPEIANVVAGAVKSSLIQEEFTFTSGLPESKNSAELVAFFDQYGHITAIKHHGDGLSIGTVVGLRQIGNVRVRATELKEGMVLAEDFRNRGGVLIVRAGTRLTTSYAERLASFGAECFVEICDPLAPA